MASLSSPSRRIALLEDIPYASNFSPAACLAANPSNVQACSIPFPNPKAPGQQVAEAAAAKAERARFIPTVPWLCTNRCSMVIGNYIAYSDGSHVSLTYSEYLSQVMDDAIHPIL